MNYAIILLVFRYIFMKNKVISLKVLGKVTTTIKILLNQDDTRISRAKYQKRLILDTVFTKIKGVSVELEYIMTEVVKNSFDSGLDRLIEIGEGRSHLLVVTIEAYHTESELVINVIDNGKSAILNEEGVPVKRRRNQQFHFGHEHVGINRIRQNLRRYNGRISWHPYTEGTKTEIRFPKEHVSSPI